MKLVVGILVGALVGFGAGCGGAIADETDETDLPTDFHATAGSLLTDDSEDDDDDGDQAKGDDGDGDHHRKKHRKHLFKRLDRLDGSKDGKIVIAALPARVPARLIAKLKAIDTDGNGEVSREEAHTAWKHHHGK